MEAYFLLIGAVWAFFAACCWQFNFKCGGRFEKTRIPDNSFFRKIYPFKEDPLDPLLYVKLIPFLVCTLVFIAVLIVYIIYWINPNLLSAFLTSDICMVVSFSYSFLTSIYVFILQI